MLVFNMFALEAWHCALASGVPAVLVSPYPPWNGPPPAHLLQLPTAFPVAHRHIHSACSRGISAECWRVWGCPLLHAERWAHLWDGIQHWFGHSATQQSSPAPHLSRAPLPPLHALVLTSGVLLPDSGSDPAYVCCGRPAPRLPPPKAQQEVAQVWQVVRHGSSPVGVLVASLATPERMGLMGEAPAVLATFEALARTSGRTVLLQCDANTPGGVWETHCGDAHKAAAAGASVAAWCSWVADPHQAAQSEHAAGVFCVPFTLDHQELLSLAQAAHTAGTPPSAPVVFMHHGGVGSAHLALQLGVPQVMVPFAFDQPSRADEWESVGLAAALRTGSLHRQEISWRVAQAHSSSDDSDTSEGSADAGTVQRLRVASTAHKIVAAMHVAIACNASLHTSAIRASVATDSAVVGQASQEQRDAALVSHSAWAQRWAHASASSCVFGSLQTSSTLHTLAVSMSRLPSHGWRVSSVHCKTLQLSLGAQEAMSQRSASCGEHPGANDVEYFSVTQHILAGSQGASELQFLVSELWAGGAYLNLLDCGEERTSKPQHNAAGAAATVGAGGCRLLLDVGAHVGLFTLQAASLLCRGGGAGGEGPLLVVAVEPVPTSLALLLDNFALNDLPFSLLASPEQLAGAVQQCCQHLAATAAGGGGGKTPFSAVHVLVCPWALVSPHSSAQQVRMAVPRGGTCQAHVLPAAGAAAVEGAGTSVQPPTAWDEQEVVMVVTSMPAVAFFDACRVGSDGGVQGGVMVKVDVEGCELPVISGLLQGGHHWGTHDIYMAVEVHPDSARAVHEVLTAAGASFSGGEGAGVGDLEQQGWVVHARTSAQATRGTGDGSKGAGSAS